MDKSKTAPESAYSRQKGTEMTPKHPKAPDYTLHNTIPHEQRSIRLSGPFTDQHIAAFLDLLRQIDAANPLGVFTVTVLDPESSTDDVEKMLLAALPLLPERATAFASAAYFDESYPERACDYCGRPYRGPAVYCCLQHAILDA